MSGSERLLDLLAARATEGLSDVDRAELDRLLQTRDDVDTDAFELTAAEIDLAWSRAAEDTEPMPEMLRRRVLVRAGARRSRGPLAPAFLGWYAAAAILLLALWSPWNRGPERPATPPPAPPTLAELRESLIESSPDIVQVAWAPSEIESYTGVTGDVVWSDATQSGFMRLRGLPANDPSRAQYQLWIVDPSRDERPIDGGVFDVAASAGGEVIVPIDAKLRVDRPAAFAITLEQPGGVVVSDGPLLVVAPVET